MSVSLSYVDMRVSSKRGIVEVESEPSWVASFIERMDQRLDPNERRIEHRVDERLAKAVAGGPSFGNWSFQKEWCRTEPTVR